MARRLVIPPLSEIGPDTPLRLDVAARVAYPDGSMTAHGLRKEAKRGRLMIERTAGKDYTTLAAIGRMRELCRLPRVVAPSGQRPSGEPSRPDFERARAALMQTLDKLRGPGRSIRKAQGKAPRRKKGTRGDSQSPLPDV